MARKRQSKQHKISYSGPSLNFECSFKGKLLPWLKAATLYLAGCLTAWLLK